MQISNEKALVDRFHGDQRRGRSILVKMIKGALASVEPKQLVHSAVNFDHKHRILSIQGQKIALTHKSKICIVGGGKASGEMAQTIESIFGDFLADGIVIVPDNLKTKYANQTTKIQILGGSHPLPSKEGQENVVKMLSLLDSQPSDTFILCLISGGGSALLPAPADGITLENLSEVNKLLLASGASIHEFNVIRKHLSAIKGGHLAARIYPRPWASLIISDVVGDNLETIASGPTVPDPSTFQDMHSILKKYSLIDRLPLPVLNRLHQGLAKKIPGTIKDLKIFSGGKNYVIGNIKVACETALDIAKTLRIPGEIVSTTLTGEASEVGSQLATKLSKIVANAEGNKLPYVLIYGGETTVKLKGKGRGGRNQELAVSGSRYLTEPNTFLASVATDGVDGTDPVAGGIVDWETRIRSEKMGLQISDFLETNDTFSFLHKLGDLIDTGPTGTNVMDMQILLALAKKN